MGDNNLEIQLGSTKHINSVDEDTFTNIELNNSKGELLEYDINNVLSITDVFEQERQNNETYRIYGSIEYLSQFNGMRKSYSELEDFFISRACNPGYNCDFKTIYDDFNFYLVKPSNSFRKLPGDSITYVRNFEVIATPNEFELFEAGFSKNIFNQQKYCFIFNKNFNISNIVDALGMPLTEFYLYAQYIPKSVPHGVERMFRTFWSNPLSESSVTIYPQQLSIGDLIYGDKIEYYEFDFNQIKISPQTYKIITPYIEINTFLKSEPEIEEKELRWKYNPFTPIRLQFFSNDLNKVSIYNSSYNEVNSIPHYATHIGNGNYIWKNILEQGYVNPITGEGVDYPFVNGNRYLFNNIIISISPDLTHHNTRNVYNSIKFNEPNLLNKNVVTNLDNIGDPC